MKKLLFLFVSLIIFINVNAQNDTNNDTDNNTAPTKNAPAQFSLFYPIGTSGKSSINYRYNLSFNLGYGRTGGINGLEISGLAGISNGNVRGLQISGLAGVARNVTGLQISGLGSVTNNLNGFQLGGLLGAANNVQGIQTTGLIGIANDINGIQFTGLIGLGNNLRGVQASGIIGIANNVKGIHLTGVLGITNNVKGIQLAGILGITNNSKGIQLTGIGGIANNIKGAQVNGIFGISNNVKGIQFSDIANIANEVKGVQVAGAFNRTKTLRGFQFAIVNITDTVASGIPMGIVSIVKKGGFSQWEFSSSDIVNVGVSYKLGIRKFYSIYSAGYNFFKDRLFVAGFGFGSNMPIGVENKYEFQPELVNYTYFPTNFKNIRYTNATQLKIGFIRNFNKKVGLLVAPTVYVSTMSQKDGIFGYTISPINPIYQHKNANHKVSIGIGYTLGLILK